MKPIIFRLCAVLALALLLFQPSIVNAKEMNGLSSAFWSPDGQQIAFVVHKIDKSALFVVGKGESKPLKIADQAQTADWSPDGKWIVYGDQVRNTSTIYTIAPDGSQRTKIATGYLPAWSSDGKHIAYINNEALYVVNADGSADSRLLERSALHVWSFRWAPDGKRIAVARGGAGDNRAKVTLVNPDGTGVKQIADGVGSLLSWAPDSRHIVYSGDCDARFSTGVCIVDADNPAAPTLITRTGEGPRWSPVGENIAVAVNGGICLIDVNGSNRRCLTDPNSNDWLEPSAWSPDGKQILVTRAHEQKAKNKNEPPLLYFEVLVYQVDGSGFYALPGGVDSL
jgi:Tol biopolymer transport system component